jgi:hypothetical protein
LDAVPERALSLAKDHTRRVSAHRPFSRHPSSHLMATPIPSAKDVAAQCMLLLDEVITQYGDLLANYQGSISSSHKTKRSQKLLKNCRIQLVPMPERVLPSIKDLIGELNKSLPDEPASQFWLPAVFRETLAHAKELVEDAKGVELDQVFNLFADSFHKQPKRNPKTSTQVRRRFIMSLILRSLTSFRARRGRR